MLMQVSAEEEFACVDPMEEDDTNFCSTLSASCAEDEKIMIDKIHYGVKHVNGTCSLNVTDCKTFLRGCCAYTDNDEITQRTTSEVSSVYYQCEGKRNCTFKPSDMGIRNLKSESYIMFEYFCVNGR